MINEAVRNCLVCRDPLSETSLGQDINSIEDCTMATEDQHSKVRTARFTLSNIYAEMNDQDGLS